jgi:hypothetical protein
MGHARSEANNMPTNPENRFLCVLAAVAIPRVGSLRGSLAAWLGWAGVDLGLYWAVFIGAH